MAGVIHQREIVGVRSKVVESVVESGDHVSELGDVGAAAVVGVGQQRDPMVARHDQAEPDKTQVGAFLFRVSALRDWGPVIRGVDVGREVRHVQHQSGQIDIELVDDPGGDPCLNLVEMGCGDGVHRVPEPAVIQRCGREPHPAVPGSCFPPVNEAAFRARVHNPVRARQRHIGPDRGRGVAAADTDDVVDDLHNVEAFDDRPHRREVPEREVAGAVRITRTRLGQAGFDLCSGPQIALRHDPWFAVHACRFGQVVVGLAVLLLPHNSHI